MASDCIKNAECQGGRCRKGSCITMLALGDVCNDVSQCPPGCVCHKDVHRCVPTGKSPVLLADDSCHDRSNCKSGQYCSSGRCMRRQGAFTQCNPALDDEDCEDGTVCVQGHCLPLCRTDSDCDSVSHCRVGLIDGNRNKVCVKDGPMPLGVVVALIIGGAVLVGLALAAVYVFWKQRRRSHFNLKSSDQVKDEVPTTESPPWPGISEGHPTSYLDAIWISPTAKQSATLNSTSESPSLIPEISDKVDIKTPKSGQ